MERYETLGMLGEGSYGTVLKCRHRDTGRVVAVKKFLESDDDKSVKKIAQREIKMLKQLRHDNLVNLLEVWRHRRRWHLVFEFVERTVLDDLEQNPSGLELDTVRQYLYQILRATAFCHQNNIIHRDIKPENILVSQRGVVKLCDFGFARTMASPGQGVVYTDYVATRWYRAPELLVGDAKYGKPVDVWAVGCLLVELVTGQPLFPGDSDLDQLYHIVRCFGNLTARHQEMFYRNPALSGGRLPEGSAREPLKQRYPELTHTTLDLAQACLQMDPESRAQCSDLLQHLFFTRDSFHLRFTNDLHAKIQKDHRENSFLPKITKSPSRERGAGEERNEGGKDKRRTEEVEEKTRKAKEKREREEREERAGKPKNKQNFKCSKTVSSDWSEATKAATSFTENNTTAKSKLGKTSITEQRKEHTNNKKHLNEPILSKISDSCSESKTAMLSRTEDKLTTVKFKPWRTSNSELNQHLGIDINHMERNVQKRSHTSTADHTDMSLTPKPSRKSTVDHTDTNTSLKMTKMSTADFPEVNSTPKTSKMSHNNHLDVTSTPKDSKTSSNSCTKVSKMAATTMAFPTKPCKTSTVDLSTTERRRDPECPKIQLQQESSVVHRETSGTGSTPLKAGQTTTTFLGCTKATASLLKLSITTWTSDATLADETMHEPTKPSKVLPTDKEHTEVSTVSTDQEDSCSVSTIEAKKELGCSNTTITTKSTVVNTEIFDVNTDVQNTCNPSNGEHGEKPGSAEILSINEQRNPNFKITPVTRTPPTAPRESSTTDYPESSALPIIPKQLQTPNKENRREAASSDASTKTKTTTNPSPQDCRSSNIQQRSNRREAEPGVKVTTLTPKASTAESDVNPGSFDSYANSTVTATPKTPKMAFPTKVKMGNDDSGTDEKANRVEAKTSEDQNGVTVTPATLPDKNQPPVPPPPPPPASTPLLPPSFKHPVSLIPPRSGNDNSLRAGLLPGTQSLRCLDKPRRHGGIYSRLTPQSVSTHTAGVLTAQVFSEKSVIHERSLLSDRGNHGNCGHVVARRKPDVRFPDLRSGSLLPDGKHNKGVNMEQRKSKQTISSITPAESQTRQHNSTDTHTLTHTP